MKEINTVNQKSFPEHREIAQAISEHRGIRDGISSSEYPKENFERKMILKKEKLYHIICLTRELEGECWSPNPAK